MGLLTGLLWIILSLFFLGFFPLKDFSKTFLCDNCLNHVLADLSLLICLKGQSAMLL